MTEYHNYLAVIGRMEGDNEDTVNLYENMTRAEAYEHFREDRTYENPIEQAEAGENKTGMLDGVIVNYILTSESPISIDDPMGCLLVSMDNG